MIDRYSVTIGKEFINSKNKKRIVFDVHKNMYNGKTRVLYTSSKIETEVVKSCYIETFVKWINS